MEIFPDIQHTDSTFEKELYFTAKRAKKSPPAIANGDLYDLNLC